jgi:2-succinyl-5-enolpyruvyl-6-hydroxy-3-cyclohexene-1-carboxylate synthase
MADTIASATPPLANNPLYVYAGAFVDELYRSGIYHVIICPGSRSTPLAITFAAHPTMQVWMHVDERSAAFFALGMAKRLAQPVALLCTSGTAAANFLAAIVEANLSHVPLLVLTADRPPELRENGAPQAIDQNRLYGSHVKWFMDAALPEATNAALRYIRTLACRATALTHATPAGPVHLNMPLREPLTPEARANEPLPEQHSRDSIAWEGRPDGAPYAVVSESPLGAPSALEITRLAKLLNGVERGIIVAGPQDDEALIGPLRTLACRLRYPILADPLSQLRAQKSQSDEQHVLCTYDAFLRNEHFITRAAPQMVMRFGAIPTSKPLLLYLKRYVDCPQIVIDGNGGSMGWQEPTQLASQLIHSNPATLCQDLLNTLEGQMPVVTRSSWLTTWQMAETVSRKALDTTMRDFAPLFEGRVFTELAELLPEGSTLYAGNSMPVRDMDTFFWPERSIRIMGNRGANGIDGVISSALGAAAANHIADRQEPTVLVIGDLSFFHDLNGLLAAHLHQLNVTIILINNDGGGIFSFLPQADHPEHFEQLFGTPIGLDFQHAVRMYGGSLQRVQDWQEFRHTVKESFTNKGLHVIEVNTERASNVTMHRQLWHAVDRVLQEEM